MNYNCNTLWVTNNFDFCNVCIFAFWKIRYQFTDLEVFKNEVCIFTRICIPARLAEKGLPTVVETGEAAFYGPKLDFMVKDALGREWQLGTIQVDYNLPERFGLEYIGSDGQKHRPVMIHRAPFGSLERFVAVLLEHTAGKLPLWLTPDQVNIVPVSEKFSDYAKKVCEFLNNYEIRASVDDRNETLGKRIRESELKRIPFLVIVGEKEESEGSVSVRRQGGIDQGSMPLKDFAELVAGEVKAQLA